MHVYKLVCVHTHRKNKSYQVATWCSVVFFFSSQPKGPWSGSLVIVFVNVLFMSLCVFFPGSQVSSHIPNHKCRWSGYVKLPLGVPSSVNFCLHLVFLR